MIPALAALAVALPVKLIRCRYCCGQLRGRIMGSETLLICDNCEYFTNAPSTHAQLIHDMIGQQLAAGARSN